MRFRAAGRAIWVVALNILIAGILLESGAYLLYPWVIGETFSYDTVRARLFKDAYGSTEPVDEQVPVDREIGGRHILHPYLGYVLDPRVPPRAGIPYARHSVYGFPGETVPSKRSDDRIIVALSGGSMALQIFFEKSEEFLEALRVHPSFRGKEIELVCFAMGGFKQPQQLMALNYFLVLGAEFDWWINLDGFNEIVLPLSDNLPAGVSLDYPRAWHLYAQRSLGRNLLVNMGEIALVKDQKERLRKVFSLSVPSNSVSLLTLWEILDRAKEQRLYRLNESLKVLAQEDGPTPETSGHAYESASPSEEKALEEACRVWRESSILMARACAANGIRYVHFLQPNQYHTGSKVLTDEELLFAYAEGGYHPAAETGYPLLIEAGEELRRQGVAFFDLTQIFREEPRSVYADSCCHLNPLGNELLVSAMAERIMTAWSSED